MSQSIWSLHNGVPNSYKLLIFCRTICIQYSEFHIKYLMMRRVWVTKHISIVYITAPAPLEFHISVQLCKLVFLFTTSTLYIASHYQIQIYMEVDRNILEIVCLWFNILIQFVNYCCTLKLLMPYNQLLFKRFYVSNSS